MRTVFRVVARVTAGQLRCGRRSPSAGTTPDSLAFAYLRAGAGWTGTDVG